MVNLTLSSYAMQEWKALVQNVEPLIRTLTDMSSKLKINFEYIFILYLKHKGVSSNMIFGNMVCYMQKPCYGSLKQ